MLSVLISIILQILKYFGSGFIYAVKWQQTSAVMQ